MKIALLPEHERLIADKIASGLYVTRSEVVRDALRHLAARDPLFAPARPSVRERKRRRR